MNTEGSLQFSRFLPRVKSMSNTKLLGEISGRLCGQAKAAVSAVHTAFFRERSYIIHCKRLYADSTL